MGLMALDVGSKRIGVALAHGEMAMPAETIERTNLNADLARIADFAREHFVDEIVVGDPIALSGERGIAAQKMDAFVDRLRDVFAGRIHRVDERMTTAQVTKTLIAADVSRKKRKSVVDAMAAALILETFLARRRNGQA